MSALSIKIPIVANDPTKGTQNSNSIAAAIAAFTGTGAELLLPHGEIYLERLGASPSYCIKFGSGISDLTLRGQGMYATTLVQQGVGNGGDWHLLVMEGCQRIEVCDLGMIQGVIQLPERTQQQHLVSIQNNIGVTTRHIDMHHIYFGKCLGDMWRPAAATSPNVVQDITLRDFVMEGGGAASIIQSWAPSTPYMQFAWVTNDSGKQYECTVGGTSASSIGPTGTGTPFSDSDTVLTSADPATDQILKIGHGLLTGDGPFRFTTGGGLPGGLATGTDYWIVRIDADHFQVSTKLDDPRLTTVVNITSAGTDMMLVAGTGLQHRAIVDGTVTWNYVLHGPRTGARSGVSPQRGYDRVHVSRGFINGVQNSGIDCEPTGENTMDYMTIEDVVVDNRNSNTSSAVSLGGNDRVRARHMRVRNLTVLGGATIVGNTFDLSIENLQSYATIPFRADVGVPMLEVRQQNIDMAIINPRIERIGTCAAGNGIDVDCQTGSTNLSIIGGSVLMGVVGAPCIVVNPGPNCFIGAGFCAQYTAGASGTEGIKVIANAADGANNLTVSDVRVVASSKLHAAVYLATRNAVSMHNITVHNVKSAGSAMRGVYMTFNTAAGSYDRTPILQLIDNGTDTGWVAKDQTDLTDLTTVYPIVSGGKGSNSTRRFEGAAVPNGNLTGNLGDAFVWNKTTTVSETWLKVTQTSADTPDNTGWVLVPSGTERKSADGVASPSLQTTVITGTGIALTLADGPNDSYRKIFIVPSGSGTVTPANFDNTVVTWSGACAFELVWLATEAQWFFLGGTSGAVVT